LKKFLLFTEGIGKFICDSVLLASSDFVKSHLGLWDCAHQCTLWQPVASRVTVFRLLAQSFVLSKWSILMMTGTEQFLIQGPML